MLLWKRKVPWKLAMMVAAKRLGTGVDGDQWGSVVLVVSVGVSISVIVFLG